MVEEHTHEELHKWGYNHTFMKYVIHRTLKEKQPEFKETQICPAIPNQIPTQVTDKFEYMVAQLKY